MAHVHKAIEAWYWEGLLHVSIDAYICSAGISLLWVAALGVVILFIYSVISFAFLHESFLAENDEDDLYCNNLFQCFITVIRYGLIDNLGLVSQQLVALVLLVL